jgi:hypothetical protein
MSCQIEVCPDTYVTVLTDEQRKARKPHKCHECYREISEGEKYRYERYLDDNDDFETHKTCSVCNELREILFCDFYYGQIIVDLKEAIANGDLPSEDNMLKLSDAARDTVFYWIEACRDGGME